MEEPILSLFKMPRIDPYDGMLDPFNYFESYKALMMVQGTTDALLYLAFLVTLWNVARD